MGYPEEIPILTEEEMSELLEKMDDFELTPKQRAFYLKAHERTQISMGDYQNRTAETAIYPRDGITGVLYCALGLMNEAGEVGGKIKKILRDDNGEIADEKREALAGEMGDVLWYISQLCSELGLAMDEVARENLKKLASRKERGKLKGSGDNR